MYDTVLANYTYFYCWDTPSHSEPCLEPEYKQISFKNGYSRIYPDEHLWDDPGFPCPHCGHAGLGKRFKCNYQIY